ncbi:hypothetical protein DRW42_27730 [Pedobacter miscanthi]|uniref:Uncharacterized protein n=1 Tax=Pedobacter miscanthi TaxID=2259170 RepID=A0A366KM63_9SPHI|nr:hypothetical protein DRW42_27730 [Pedobacter miscanthi]
MEGRLRLQQEGRHLDWRAAEWRDLSQDRFCDFVKSDSYPIARTQIPIFFFPPMPRGHGSFSQLMLFLIVFKNAAHFGAPKYPKRFVNPAMCTHTRPIHIKKTTALCFVRQILS